MSKGRELKMKRNCSLFYIGFMFLLIVSGGLKADQILAQWNVNSDRTVEILGWYTEGNIDVKKTFDPDAELPGGARGATKIEIGKNKIGSSPSAIQLSFLYYEGVKENQKYKISFMYKISQPGKIYANVIMNKKPWSDLAENTCLTIDAKGDEWQKAVLLFTSAYDYKDQIRAPYLALGKLEPGTVLWINDVKFEMVSEK
jgi:hypothetical protein